MSALFNDLTAGTRLDTRQKQGGTHGPAAGKSWDAPGSRFPALSSSSGSRNSLRWAAGPERTPPRPSPMTPRRRRAQFYFPSEFCAASSSPSPVSPCSASSPRRARVFPPPPAPSGPLCRTTEIHGRSSAAVSRQGDACLPPLASLRRCCRCRCPLPLRHPCFLPPAPLPPRQPGWEVQPGTGTNDRQTPSFQQAAQIPRSFIR